jgi:hypothetical protein
VRARTAVVAAAGTTVAAAATAGVWAGAPAWGDRVNYYRLVYDRESGTGYGAHCTTKQLVTDANPNYKWDTFHWVQPRHGPGDGSPWQVLAFRYDWVDNMNVIHPIRVESGGGDFQPRGYGPSGKRVTPSDTYRLRFESITLWRWRSGGSSTYSAVSEFGWGGWTDNGWNRNNPYCTA